MSLLRRVRDLERGRGDEGRSWAFLAGVGLVVDLATGGEEVPLADFQRAFPSVRVERLKAYAAFDPRDV